MMDELERVLDALRSSSDAPTKVINNLMSLLYGDPATLPPAGMTIDWERFATMRSWEGLRGIQRHGERLGGILLVNSRLRPEELLKIERLEDTAINRRAAETCAHAMTAVHEESQLVVFAPAVCDRLAATVVHPRDELTALGLVASQTVTIKDEPKNALLTASIEGAPPVSEDSELFDDLEFVPDNSEQMTLFDARPDDGLVPSFWLQVADWDERWQSRGPGAPVTQRLLLEAATWLEAEKRTGEMQPFNVWLGDVLDRCWPYGFVYRSDSWAMLEAVFRAVSAKRILYTDENHVERALHPVVFTDYPRRAPQEPRWLAHARVVGALTMPEGAHRGPSLSRAVLRHAGSISGPAQRLAVAWAFYRGRFYALRDPRGQQRLSPPTIPRARVDDAGRYLGADGSVLLNRNGKPIGRWKDKRVILVDEQGAPVRDVRSAARVRNPALDRAEGYSLDQWRKMVLTRPAKDKRRAHEERERIKEAFADLAAAGVWRVELLPGGLYRPVPPGDVGRMPSERELRDDHERRLNELRKARRDRRANRNGQRRLV